MLLKSIYVVYLGLYKCFLSISASIFPVIAGAPNIEEKILADVWLGLTVYLVPGPAGRYKNILI